MKRNKTNTALNKSVLLSVHHDHYRTYQRMPDDEGQLCKLSHQKRKFEEEA